MGDTADKPQKKVSQERGKSFPVLSLPEAVKIIRDAGVYGNTHHIDALATYAGHSTANSGAFRSKVAALKDWGLIVGNNGTISLTDSAIQLANPVDQSTTLKVLQDLFESCEIFWDIYTNTAKGTALDVEGIANKGVTTYKVSVKGKKNFAQSFIESAESVNLLERIGDKVKLLATKDEQDETTSTAPAADNDAPVTPPLEPKKEEKSGHAVNQTWEFEGGTIDLGLYTEKPLDSSAYAFISKVIKEIEALKDQLVEPKPPLKEASNGDIPE